MSANQKLLLLCVVTLGLGLALGSLGSRWLPDPSAPGRTTPEVALSDSARSAVPADARVPGWDGRWGIRPQFVDVTAESGISFQHTNGMAEGKYEYLEVMGGGVAAFDYDQDGDLDLYFINGNRSRGAPDPAITNRLYRNEGNLKFSDVTEQAGVGDAGYGQGCAAGDYDGDGDLDLYVTNYGPNVLYRNNGDGTFADVTQEAGVADDGWGQSVCFFDFDRDGRLDLLVQNYLARGATEGVEAYINIGPRKVPDYPSPLGFPGAPSRLFQNQGDGTFREVAQEAGLTRQDGKGMGLACVDLTGDGWPEIFLSNDTMENFLYRNQGNGRFEEIGHLAGVAYSASGVPEASMGVDVADFDDDGDLDLIVPCLARQFFTLYRNDGTQFADASSMVGLDQATAGATGFDAHFLDYDNDGDRDLFFTCGGVRMVESAPADASYTRRDGIPDLLVANDGTGRFQDVSRWAGAYFQHAWIGRGSVVGDLDDDGDLDLVISNLADRAIVLRNDTPGGHWLTLELIDSRGRRQPDAVSVWVTAAGRRQHGVTHPGTTYLSQSDRRLHFGLGDARKIEQLVIRWPDGTEHTLSDVAVDQILKLRQESGGARVMESR